MKGKDFYIYGFQDSVHFWSGMFGPKPIWVLKSYLKGIFPIVYSFCGELVYPEPESTSTALNLMGKSKYIDRFRLDRIKWLNTGNVCRRFEWSRSCCLGNIQSVVQAVWISLELCLSWNRFNREPDTFDIYWREIGKTRRWKWPRSYWMNHSSDYQIVINASESVQS